MARPSNLAPLAPMNLEAEEALLGAMLLAGDAIDAASEILEPDGQAKFYRDSHGLIYRTLLDLHRATGQTDVVTLLAALEQTGRLETVGGKQRVIELAAITPAVALTGRYASLVKDEWLLRQMVRVGSEIQRLAYDGTGDNADKLRAAEQMFDDVRAQLERGRASVVKLFDAAAYLDDKFRNPPEQETGVKTPWSFLPPMHGGRLYVLSGYTADGKTVQAGHFFRSAVEGGTRTGLLTLEMGWEDMAERLCAMMGVPAKRVQSGVLLDTQRDAADRAVRRMAMWDADIIDDPAADVAAIRRYLKTGGYGFLIVDHLHQFHLRAEYERQDIEAIVRGLWQLSREFNIPILLLAQLSKASDKSNPFPRPTLASLKGSAIIEQLAWCVWFIWRHRDERKLPTAEAEWIVAKNRSGDTGTRPLSFLPAQTRYEEVAHER